MEFKLNWYDTDYRYGSNPKVDQQIDRLNELLWEKWVLVYSDEYGNTATRDTDNVVLRLKDDLPSRIIDHAKSISRDLLDAMWVESSKNEHLSQLTWKVEVTGYELEKVNRMKDKFNFIVEKLGLISSLILDANELGINVQNFPGYFDFAEFYNRHMTELDDLEKIDLTELSQNISKFYWALERAVHERQNQPSNEDPLIIIKIDEYEIERLNKMKNKFNYIINNLDYIQDYLFQAKALGINVNQIPGYFDFTEFYANCMTEIENQGTIDFTELSQNISKFNASLKYAVLEWEKMQDRIE